MVVVVGCCSCDCNSSLVIFHHRVSTSYLYIDRPTTMASRALIPLLRRSIVSTRASSKALKGGGGSPPMPAFARIPAPSEAVRLMNRLD
jgi:hypothetical protein